MIFVEKKTSADCSLVPPKDATLPNFAAREQWLTLPLDVPVSVHACPGINNNVLLGSEVRVVT